MARGALSRIFLLGAMLLAPMAALGEENIVVSGARVRLIDIMPDAPRALQNSDLGPAPPPGRSRYLDPEEIVSRLKAQGVAASSLKLPRGVRVESAAHLFTPDELAQLVRGPLSDAMPEGATLIEHSVTSEHLLSPSVRVGAVRLPDLIRGRDLVSQIVTVELTSDGTTVLRLPVRIKVKVSATLREAFVERGARVTLSIVRGQVEVSGIAETLRAGKVGETVSVRVLSTNKVVTAELIAPERARLEIK